MTSYYDDGGGGGRRGRGGRTPREEVDLGDARDPRYAELVRQGPPFKTRPAKKEKKEKKEKKDKKEKRTAKTELRAKPAGRNTGEPSERQTSEPSESRRLAARRRPGLARRTGYAWRMLATKSKPKPRFSEEDGKKARERLKRLEQEAHDAKLAAGLQRKQFDKDFGDNSDDDDRRPNPSPFGSGIPRDSQGRAIEPDRRRRSRSRHERPAPEKPPKRGRHKEPEKPERPVTPPRGPKHKKEGDKA